MFLLVTYDVPADRTEKFRKLLSRYLVHEQASVFSGNVTDSVLVRLHGELRALVTKDDRVLQFKAANRHNVVVASLTKGPNGTLVEKPHNLHADDSFVL